MLRELLIDSLERIFRWLRRAVVFFSFNNMYTHTHTHTYRPTNARLKWFSPGSHSTSAIEKRRTTKNYVFKEEKNRKEKRAHGSHTDTSVRNVLLLKCGRCFSLIRWSWSSNFLFFSFIFIWDSLFCVRKGGFGEEEDEEAKDMKLCRTPVLGLSAARGRCV